MKAEAERLRIGLLGGWRLVPEIVEWADAILAREDKPPPEVIDLSLAGRQPAEKVATLLRAVPGTVNSIATMRQSLGDLREWIGEDIERGEQAASWLYSMAKIGLLPDAHFGSEPFSLDEHFVLARAGTYRGTLRDALAYLLRWLDAASNEGQA